MNPELMTNHQQRVLRTMVQSDQPVKEYPQVPDLATRKLAGKLILEEAFETIKALGLSVDVIAIHNNQTASVSLPQQPQFTFEAFGAPDLTEIVDGCLDTRVVTTWTLVACGVADGPIIAEIDQSNWNKVKDGAIKIDGKYQKPPGWQKPRVAELIQMQLEEHKRSLQPAG